MIFGAQVFKQLLAWKFQFLGNWVDLKQMLKL
jgi:hypothetical protein